jgi:cell division protein FtsB
MFVAAFATLLFFITATVYYFEFLKLRRLKFAVAESSARLAEKESSVRDHREKVAFYRTDEGIAHLAREQYNMALPGERVFIVRREYSENVTEVGRP